MALGPKDVGAARSAETDKHLHDLQKRIDDTIANGRYDQKRFEIYGYPLPEERVRELVAQYKEAGWEVEARTFDVGMGAKQLQVTLIAPSTSKS